MIGSIIGGALKIGSSIWGGISAAKAAREARNRIGGQLESNRAWYDRKYNEDATQRADAQRLLAITEQRIRDRNRRAEASAAVTGATDESVAMAKASGNQAVADAVAHIADNAEARKDQIEQQYLSREGDLQRRLEEIDRDKARNIASAAGGVGLAAGGLVDFFAGR